MLASWHLRNRASRTATVLLILRARRRQRDHQRRVRQHVRLLTKKINYPPQRVYRQRMSYEMMSEELCVRRLGFSKEAIGRLCEILKDDLKPSSKCLTALTVPMKVTIALNFFACGSLQSDTGDMCNISQSAARTCIHQVTEAIFRRASDFIHFDMSPVRMKERSLAFYEIAGFPEVIGAIDGTHVPLKPPKDQPVSFVNRKGFHSLNVMIVCDAQMKILTVNADNRGSAHDSFVLANSRLHRAMSASPGLTGWLLGDEDYPLRTWLMTPYRGTRSKAQERYNRAHVTTRKVVEKAVGALKSRFRCLRSGGTLQYSPVKVSKIVVVCCALHNFALQEGLTLHLEDDLAPEVEELEECNVDPDSDVPPGVWEEARTARDHLVATAFEH
ncbi:putative nuclease HARBI1 isoform X2 [Carcharodon carcharias]|uniref:putative nuclease HARBI1 isoform X2 n=1 Tax=Carcharodon carcharias TaxID=13397 RepID=UPI001B7DCC7C|nr:putative nuclease HARBI1 isoform X2 [Carcharodon carcharias]